MEWSRFTKTVNGHIRGVMWWVAVGPFCLASELPTLSVAEERPLRLSGQPDPYPSNELLGRLLSFQSRLRFARSVVILFRAILLCMAFLALARAVEITTHWLMSPWLPIAILLVLGWALHLSLHHSISTFEVARLVDKRMALRAQLATAVESTWQRRQLDSLGQAQARLATRHLREIDPRRTIPLVFPGRDARVLLGIIVLYVGLSVVGNFGLSVPHPPQAIDAELAKQVSQDAQAPSPFVSLDSTAAQIQTLAAPQSSDSVGQQLKSLDQQLKSQAITAAEYQAQLQALQKQVQAEANQSLAAQEALQRLAQAMNNSSTTQPISDSLTRGNYQQAASQLNDLAKGVSGMSPQSQSQLGQQFAQAAQQTQALSQPLSQNAAQAAQALQQGQSNQAQQSLQKLAQAVNDTNQQITQQSQLGQDLQQVQQRMGSQSQAAGTQSQQANSNSPQAGNQASASAQGSQSSSGNQSSSSDAANAQSSSDSSATNGNTASDQASVSSSGPGQDQASQQAGGGAGNGPGSSLFGNAPTPLDVNAKKLVILGQASDNGASGSTTAGDRTNPLTGATGSSIATSGGSAPAASNAPVNVHQESNAVPLDLKPVVREYFSHAP